MILFSLFLLFFLSLSSYLEGHSPDHGGLSVVHISKHLPFHGADSQVHGRLSVEHISKLSCRKKLYVRPGLLGPHCKKVGALGTCTRADACAFTSEPQHFFFVCHCLGAWEPGTCGHDMGTRRSWSRFPYDGMDTALNSQVRQRTVMARGALSE